MQVQVSNLIRDCMQGIFHEIASPYRARNDGKLIRGTFPPHPSSLAQRQIKFFTEDEMEKRLTLLASFVLLSVLILSACGAAATQAPAMEMPAYAPAATEAPALVEPAFGAGGGADAAQPQTGEATSAPTAGPSDYAPASGDTNSPSEAGRKIVKNADMRLLVEDTDTAIDRMTQVVGDLGGYIISSRVWYQPYYDGENYKYATISMGVPVDQFEKALTRLRGLSIQVLDETASGEDVTDQYVDLQSQLTNLEATRERIKTFLDQATTVDEALRVNQELSEIERQIEEIKGRMNYLSDRSAYSTITVNFEPRLPDIVPTPTPTSIPTATPTPWSPGDAFDHSIKSVTTAYQGIVEFLIWFFIVLVPILAPFAFIAWIIWRVLRRKPK
jgi:hypothetical protein